MSLKRLSFLAVDDNPHMAEIVKTILRAGGVGRFARAASACDALNYLRHNTVDIAIFDYNLGDMDGIDLTTVIRRSPDSPNPHLPIVMLTAHSDEWRVRAARDAGVNEFCCKPVTAWDLLAKISNVILRPRPYVRTADYYGPDRRRRHDAGYCGPERRLSEHEALVA